MTTVVNNPGSSGDSSGVGMVLGVILGIALIVLFFVFALPAIRGNGADKGSVDLNIDLPTGGDASGGGTAQ